MFTTSHRCCLWVLYMRPIWFFMGLSSVFLGMMGALLPLLPTVPFMILGAYCFARSSQRMHDWLLNHRLFGPAIVDWQRSGAISKPAKYAATVSVAAVFSLSLIMGLRPMLIGIQAVTLCGVMCFIWTRPHH